MSGFGSVTRQGNVTFIRTLVIGHNGTKGVRITEVVSLASLE